MESLTLLTSWFPLSCLFVCPKSLGFTACKVASVMSDSAIPWTVGCQAPLLMGFSRQKYWSQLPFPPSGDIPDLWIKPASLTFPALAGGFFTTGATWEALLLLLLSCFSRVRFCATP